MKKKVTYATIYDPNEDGICHGCIHYEDEGNVRNQTLSGAMPIDEVKQHAGDAPIWDITNTSKILGLTPENMEKFGAKRI